MDAARWRRLHHFLLAVEDRYRSEHGYGPEVNVVKAVSGRGGISRGSWDAWKNNANKEGDNPAGLSYDALEPLARAGNCSVHDVFCAIEGLTENLDIPLPTRVVLSPPDVQAAVLEAMAAKMRMVAPPLAKISAEKIQAEREQTTDADD
jgi:hypothetical protein